MRSLLTLFFLGLSVYLTAQDIDSFSLAPPSVAVDSIIDTLSELPSETMFIANEKIDERSWSEEDFDEFSGTAFNYAPKQPSGGIGTFLAWLASLLPTGSGTAAQWQIFEILFYLICVCLLIYAIFSALGLSTSRVFRRAEKSILDYEVEEADITKLDFARLIKEARDKKDYRLAVRYHYLQALDALSKAGLIDWQYHKTNRDYLYELYNSKHKGEFSRLTELFEHIWYGAIDLKGEQFESMATQFSKFKSRFSS